MDAGANWEVLINNSSIALFLRLVFIITICEAQLGSIVLPFVVTDLDRA